MFLLENLEQLNFAKLDNHLWFSFNPKISGGSSPLPLPKSVFSIFKAENIKTEKSYIETYNIKLIKTSLTCSNIFAKLSRFGLAKFLSLLNKSNFPHCVSN